MFAQLLRNFFKAERTGYLLCVEFEMLKKKYAYMFQIGSNQISWGRIDSDQRISEFFDLTLGTQKQGLFQQDNTNSANHNVLTGVKDSDVQQP